MVTGLHHLGIETKLNMQWMEHSCSCHSGKKWKSLRRKGSEINDVLRKHPPNKLLLLTRFPFQSLHCLPVPARDWSFTTWAFGRHLRLNGIRKTWKVSISYKENQKLDSESSGLQSLPVPSGIRYVDTHIYPGSPGSTPQVGFQLCQHSLDLIISLVYMQPSAFENKATDQMLALLIEHLNFWQPIHA